MPKVFIRPDENVFPDRPPRDRWPYTPPPPPLAEGRWFDWLLPDALFLRWRSGVSQPGDLRGRWLRESDVHGNIDSGHCADAPDWDERGGCMCTLTWRMPGSFPRDACTTVTVTTGTPSPEKMPFPSRRRRPRRSRVDDSNSPGVDVHTQQAQFERLYNLQASRHEYVAMQVDGNHDGHIVGNSPHYSGSRCKAAPFTCSDTPWVRHVDRFFRAEELATPPPPASQFVSRTGLVRIEGSFSAGFYKVPYYDAQTRTFRYADGNADMTRLRLNFISNVSQPSLPRPPPPPHTLALRRPRSSPKRPLVLPKGKWEQPDYSRMEPKPDMCRPFPLEQIRVEARVPEPPEVFVKPLVPKPVMRPPRSVVFPASGLPKKADHVDDTPFPPPRVRRARQKRVVKDDDAEYLPEGPNCVNDDDDDNDGSADAPPPPPVTKKPKKRRRRRNSDLAYRPNGARENNRREKEDLKKMREEEAPDAPKEEEDQVEKPRDVAPRPRRGRRRAGEKDSGYVPSGDPEEAMQELEDLREMKATNE